jgi:hypothetical protein
MMQQEETTMRSIPPPRSSWTLGFTCAVAAVWLAGAPASAATVEAKRVVDTDTAVPGGPFDDETSITFTTLMSGSAAGGQLVFSGWVQDTFGIIVGRGLYQIDVGGGEPQIIADTRTCAEEPCTPPTDAFITFGDNYSFDGTTVGFTGTLTNSSGPTGVWTATVSTLTLVVEDGDSNPSGGSFDIFGSPAIDGDEIAFTERSFSAEQGIFAAPSSAGSARTVADDTTAAPGGGGALFDPTSMTRVAYRDGVLAFRGVLDNATQGVYAEDNQGIRVVVDAQTEIPGLGGPTFTSISSVLTDDGDIAFFGGTSSTSTGRGLYVERDEALLPAPIVLAKTIGGSVDPCDQSTRLLFIDSIALGDGSVAFVSDGALYSARIGTNGLSRLLQFGDTVDGKTVDFLAGGTLHPEGISTGAVFPLISFTDGSKGIYCMGIPETPQCSPTPVPERCLTVPEPAAGTQLIAVLTSLAVLRRRRRRSRGLVARDNGLIEGER